MTLKHLSLILSVRSNAIVKYGSVSQAYKTKSRKMAYNRIISALSCMAAYISISWRVNEININVRRLAWLVKAYVGINGGYENGVMKAYSIGHQLKLNVAAAGS
jgi:hypothetical protein